MSTDNTERLSEEEKKRILDRFNADEKKKKSEETEEQSREESLIAFRQFLKDINLKPKHNCKHCHGTGYIGYYHQSSKFRFCKCISKQMMVPDATLKIEKKVKKYKDLQSKQENEKIDNIKDALGPDKINVE